MVTLSYWIAFTLRGICSELNAGDVAGVDGCETQTGVNRAGLDNQAQLAGVGERTASHRAGDRPPGLHVARIGSLGAGEGDEPDPDEAGGDGAGSQDEG